MLLAVLLPALGTARREGMAAECGASLRELGRALQMYASDHDDRAMPLSYWSIDLIGTGPVVYWWGADTPGGVEHRVGFLWPYLQNDLSGDTVFACPEQPWGSYRPQGAAKAVTSTYGYNGYYLSPPHTPGWAFGIGHMPWLGLSKTKDPARVFAFADTLIDLGGSRPFNSALLDPPQLFSAGSWSDNDSPTTAFRHRGSVQAAHVDGHVARYTPGADDLTSKRFAIGSVGRSNAPHYVPDWRAWRAAR